jgi:hypothetical protein
VKRLTWEGHTIDVRCHLEARFAWLAGGFIVLVDGRDEFRYPNRRERCGTQTQFTIEHGGKVINGVVRPVGRLSVRGTTYDVIVDGAVICTDEMSADQWRSAYAVLLILFVVGSLLICALGLLIVCMGIAFA